MSLIICVYMFIYSWINKLSVFIKQIKFVLWEEWIKIADLLMSSLPVCKKRKQFWETCKIIQRRPKDYNFTRSNCYRYRIFYSVLLSLHVQHFCKLRFFLAITSYRQWCDLRKCWTYKTYFLCSKNLIHFGVLFLVTDKLKTITEKVFWNEYSDLL